MALAQFLFRITFMLLHQKAFHRALGALKSPKTSSEISFMEEAFRSNGGSCQTALEQSPDASIQYLSIVLR